MMSKELSIEDLRRTSPYMDVSIRLQIQKFNGDSYCDFVGIVTEALDIAIRDLCQDKNIVSGVSEDQLTKYILTTLRSMSFDAAHSSNHGGNCDLLIKGHQQYIWIGEAKIFSSYSKLLGGYRQLTARYASGVPGADCGALIVYMTSHGNAKGRMAEWKRYLITSEKGVVIQEDEKKPLEFESTQDNPGSGLPMYVRHVPAILYHNPTDTLKAPKRARKVTATKA